MNCVESIGTRKGAFFAVWDILIHWDKFIGARSHHLLGVLDAQLYPVEVTQVACRSQNQCS